MGSVYLAYDRKRNAQVAIKTLRRVDSSGIYRFKREFRALADLHHSSLVQLYELFEGAGEWYFSMEYVDGEPLLDRLLGADALTAPAQVGGTRKLRPGSGATASDRPKSPLLDEALLRSVLGQIAKALVLVHGAGRLHRDLKPDNILVTADGRAVLLDFGIALQLTDEAQRTFEAGVMGTPAYMSPEQAAGRAVTAATDWYAFGVLLYQALTGGVPFEGNYLEVLKLKQHVDATPPADLVEGVPDDLNQLCMSLLARDAEARPSGQDVVPILCSTEAAATASIPAKSAVVDSGLVGRGLEMQALRDALSATDRGRPVLALVQGGTGLGKTALVQKFADELRNTTGVTVLAGRCYERERLSLKAFDGVMDALSRHLRAVPVVAAADAMPHQAMALAKLFPVLERASIFSQLRRRDPCPQDFSALRREGLHALRELLTRLARQQPLAIIVDDLQWGDEDSARLITSLLSGEGSPNALFLFTYRQGDVKGSACLRRLFDHTREHHKLDVRQVTLAPIADSEMKDLCVRSYSQRLNLSDDDVAALIAEANGNPYFLQEAVRRLEEAPLAQEGVTSLEGSLQARIEALSGGARDLLQLIAVSGRPLFERFLTELSDGEPTVMYGALAELRAQNLVRGVGTVDEPAVDTHHEGLRNVVREEMSQETLQTLHSRMAAALEQGGAEDLSALTEHLVNAQEFRRASTYAIRAAVQAYRASSFETAADLYEVAVEHCDDDGWRRDLRLQWAGALAVCGRSAQAAEVFELAAAEAEGEEGLVLGRQAGLQWMLSGHIAKGRSALRPAMAVLGIELPEFEKDSLSIAFNKHVELYDSKFEFEKKADDELDIARLARFDALWDVANGLVNFDPSLSLPLQVDAVQEALKVGHVPRIVAALCLYFMYIENVECMRRGVSPQGMALAEALAHKSGGAKERAYVAMARGTGYLHAGLYQPALLHLRNAEDLLRTRCEADHGEVRTCRQFLAFAFGVLGQFGDFRLVEQWILAADHNGDRLGGIHLRLLSVAGALAEDDCRRAQDYVRAAESWPEAQLGVTSMLVRMARTRVALYMGDLPSALTLTAPEGAEARIVVSVPAFQSELALLRLRALLFCAQVQRTHGPVPNRGGSSGAPVRDGMHLGGLVAQIEKILHQLQDCGIAHYVDHGTLCQAALHSLTGERRLALEALADIVQEAEQIGDGPILLACANIRRGQLLSQREGRPLVEAGMRSLTTLGIRSPAKFIRVYAPGFPDLDLNPASS